MKTASVTHQATAASLALLLIACGTTRVSATGPTGPEDLARYVLFITQQPDGRVTHSWRPVAEFELNTNQSQAHANGFYGRVVTATFTAEECQHEYEVCVPECLASTRIRQVSKYVYDARVHGPWRTGKYAYCDGACMKQLANCQHDVEPKPVKFEAIAPAVDWVKENRNTILVGTVVVIAGVAFVAVFVGSGGSGLALLPLLAMASSNPMSTSRMLAVKP
ncbi:hypothetical protein [Archangium violaceum]|uniref:hypothetical protein n=1 Tax=Archangium violaceum TaxID=83451 RepID=UPI0005BAAC92|nr:hypothetical protein [Archangium violaceum]